MATPDPFAAAFGTPGAPSAPATASPAPADAFEAAFGHVTPASRASASEVPPLPPGRTKPWTDLELQVLGVKRQGEDLGAGSAFAGGLIEGLPVVGPFVKRNLDEGIAHLRSWSSGKPVAEERENIKAMGAGTAGAHPDAAEAGGITGQVAGYGLAAAAAPAAFGLGAASLPAAAATSGVTNAAISALDAAARGDDPIRAAEVGGALGIFAPVVGAGVSKLFSSVIQPEVARLADLAINKFGIPLGPDLISTNPMLRFASSVMERMPFSGGQAAKEARLGAFTRAVAHEMGEDADALTPDVMNRARARIGQDFEYAAKNTPTLGADQQFGDDLTRIWQDINDPVDRALASDERKVVEGQMRRVIDLYNKGSGSITGQQYQQLTRRGTALDRATESSNPNIRYYAIQIKSALDDALMRFAPADAADTLKQARKQWWVMKTVEDVAEKAPTGHVSPALLMGAVRSASGSSMAYGGGGNMAELARIGQLFLKDAPSSGTAERALVMTLAEAAGAGFGFMLSHPIAWAAGLSAPAVIGRVAASVARSPRLGNALVRAAVGRPGPTGRAIQAAGRGGRYLLPGIVQQAQPAVDSLIPDNRAR